MELWIRSQDKESLLKADRIGVCHNYTKKIKNENYLPKGSISYDSMQTISTYVDDKYINSNVYVNKEILGTYKTKERALEVLDEIQRLMIASLVDKNLDGYGVVIYEMPKE